MRIFLIGFMGAGKSTVGHQLAVKLGIPFFDLDELVEQRAGQSVASVFGTSGESEFRALEHQELVALVEQYGDFVLACGGGTPCYYQNLPLMQQSGLTFYLATTPSVLASRLESQLADRPLLRGAGSYSALEKLIVQKLAEREPYYRQATYTVDAAVPLQEIVEKLVTYSGISES